jgi:sugar phosphate isomerase/epimerase
MQVGIRFHDSAKQPFEERLKTIASQGFSCTHLALSKVDDLPSSTESLTPGYALSLKHALEKNHIDAAVLGNYLNLANPNEEKLKEIQQRYTAHLRFASLLGCSVVGTETGAPNEDYHYDKEACHSDQALDTFITNLRPVVQDAERFGVILAIEPVYKHIVWNPERARTVLDTIHSPNLQIIFDPVNLLHPDNLAQRDEVISQAIDLLSDEIAVIHLKDYKVINGEMSCMACGLGDMDYTQVIRFAKEKKPYIQATLENTKPDNAVQAREYIQKIEESL